MQVVGKSNTAGNRVRGLLSESSTSERTYLCTLWLCTKTAISADGKMTCRLMQFFFLTVQTPYSLSVMSILGSKAPRWCHWLTFVLAFVVVWSVYLCCFACFVVVLFTLYYGLFSQWHIWVAFYTVGILCRLLLWLLSCDIMRWNDLSFEYIVCPMNLGNPAHNYPVVLASSAIMLWG